MACQAFCQALEALEVTRQASSGLAASGLSDVLSARTESRTCRGRSPLEPCWAQTIDASQDTHPSLRLRLSIQFIFKLQ